MVTNYRELYRQIRNHLAGQHLGSTRDEPLLQQVVMALLCKGELDDRSVCPPGRRRIASDYRATWSRLRAKMPTLLRDLGALELQDDAIEYLDQALKCVNLRSGDHDPLGDLYQVFIGSLARGQEGQFFTPPNAIRLLVKLVQPRPGEIVVDPACGSGGFLAATVQELIKLGEDPANAAASVIGIDKDLFLSRLAGLRLALITGRESAVRCGNSLSWSFRENNSPPITFSSSVDVVLTNPPFGSKIVATTPDIQRTFALGYKWRRSAPDGEFTKTEELVRSLSPQVAFIERCLDLLRPGGRMGIVVPESLLSSQRHRHVVQYILERARVAAVIGMPESLFKTSGSGGTHTKTCLLVVAKREHAASVADDPAIFMAETRWCGNDSRGRQHERDELPVVASRYMLESPRRPEDHLSYLVSPKSIVENILAPRYYDPEPHQLLAKLSRSHDLVSIGQLVNDQVISIASGDEIGKLTYGSGDIPFVRTSDLSNWEIKLDPKHGVSEDVYQMLCAKQDVREGDILMVRDGTYLIGTCAYVTKYDQRIVYQSHILKLRVLKPDVISPFLLLAALSCPPVKRQIVAKRFTQDIIDSIGTRILELVLPLPKDSQVRLAVIEKVARAIQERVEARELARQACIDVSNAVGLDVEPIVESL